MSNSYSDVIKRGALPLPVEMMGEFSKMLMENPKVVTAIAPFKARVRRFIVAKGSGMSMQEASVIAGYKTKNAAICGYKLLKKDGVADAVRVIEMECAFVSGIPASVKRAELYQFWTDRKESAPAAAVSAMKLLAQLDGDIQSGSAGNVGIQIVVSGIGGMPDVTVVDGELCGDDTE